MNCYNGVKNLISFNSSRGEQLPPIGPGNTLQTFVDAFNDVDDELFKASFPISYLKILDKA